MTFPKLWPVGGHPEGEAKVRQLKKLSPKWLRASGPGWVAEKQGALSNVKYGAEGGLYSVGFYVYNQALLRLRKIWMSQKERGRMRHKEALDLVVPIESAVLGNETIVLCDGVGKLTTLEDTTVDGKVVRTTRLGGAWKSTETEFLSIPGAVGQLLYVNGLQLLYGEGRFLYVASESTGWVSAGVVNHPLQSATWGYYERAIGVTVFTPTVWVVHGSDKAGRAPACNPKFYRTEDAGASWSLVPGTDALFSPGDFDRYNLDQDDTYPVERTLVQIVPVSATKAVVAVHGEAAPASDRLTLFDFATGTVVRQEVDANPVGQSLFNHGLEVVAVVGAGSWVYRKWTGQEFLRPDNSPDFRYDPTYFLARDFWQSEVAIVAAPATDPHYYVGEVYGDPIGPKITPFSAWYEPGKWLYLVMDGKRRELWVASGENLETHRRRTVLTEPDEAGDNGVEQPDWMLSFNGGGWHREFKSVSKLGAFGAMAAITNDYPWRTDARVSPPTWWLES